MEDKKTVIPRSNYKIVKISDIFTITRAKSKVAKKDINQDKKGDPYITNGITNRGLAGYTEAQGDMQEAGTFTLDVFGSCYYRHMPYKATQGMMILTPKQPITEDQALFVEWAMLYLSKKFCYSNQATTGKVENLTIKLPQTDTGDIDWDFMGKLCRVYYKIFMKRFDDYLKRELEVLRQL